MDGSFDIPISSNERMTHHKLKEENQVAIFKPEIKNNIIWSIVHHELIESISIEKKKKTKTDCVSWRIPNRYAKGATASGLSTLLMQNAVVETFSPVLIPQRQFLSIPAAGNGSTRAMRYSRHSTMMQSRPAWGRGS